MTGGGTVRTGTIVPHGAPVPRTDRVRADLAVMAASAAEIPAVSAAWAALAGAVTSAEATAAVVPAPAEAAVSAAVMAEAGAADRKSVV